jgi:ribonuclease Z
MATALPRRDGRFDGRDDDPARNRVTVVCVAIVGPGERVGKGNAMKKAAVSGLVALFLLAAAFFVGLRLEFVQDRLIDKAAAAQLTNRGHELLEEDALRALLCGTSSPLPHPTRAKACVAIYAGGKFWIVDTGPGSWNRLALTGIDPARVGGIFLTHFHSDHIGDLGQFNMQTWAGGRLEPLRVFGPAGVDRVVRGFEEAYALDRGYRVAHHGVEFMPPEIAMMVPNVVPDMKDREPTLVLEEDGLRVLAFNVDHAPVKPAVGYRFEYLGRSVVVSGDTAKSSSLITAAKGADVLIHEAQANHIVSRIENVAAKNDRPRISHIMKDIISHHTSPVQAAESANEAGVQLLVMYHLVPPPPVRLMETIFTRGVNEVRDGGWVLGDDGLLVTLPADSDDIEISSR